jgi:hypothetical protein
MEILKCAVFTPDEFETWQKEAKKYIHQLQPLFTGMNGDISESGAMNTKVSFSIFVVYVEKV